MLPDLYVWQHLFIFGLIGLVAQDVLHVALENEAQGVKRRGRDGFAVLYSVYGIGVDPLLKDEMVFRHTSSLKRLKKWLIADHNSSTLRSYCNRLNILTILKNQLIKSKNFST